MVLYLTHKSPDKRKAEQWVQKLVWKYRAFLFDNQVIFSLLLVYLRKIGFCVTMDALDHEHFRCSMYLNMRHIFEFFMQLFVLDAPRYFLLHEGLSLENKRALKPYELFRLQQVVDYHYRSQFDIPMHIGLVEEITRRENVFLDSYKFFVVKHFEETLYPPMLHTLILASFSKKGKNARANWFGKLSRDIVTLILRKIKEVHFECLDTSFALDNEKARQYFSSLNLYL